MGKYVLLVLLVCVSAAYASKILVVFPIPTNSHANLGDGYIRNLLKAGHEVTYITALPAKTVSPKLRTIMVDITKSAVPEKSLNIDVLMRKEIEMDYNHMFKMMYNISKLMLQHEAVDSLMNDPREQFDLVIAEWMFNDIYSGFSAVFNCPYIWSLPFEPNFITLSLIDEATNPSYTPDVAYSFVPPFSFIERAQMLWFQLISTAATTFYYRNIEKGLYETTFQEIVARKGRTLPPYDDVRLNASLILGNTHVSYGTKMRLPQNFKSIGGYHIDSNVKPLTADLKKIMDGAKHGVIYFSMGSNLKSKDFSNEIKTNLLEMFGTLKQTVIWKFEDSFSSVPKNVHILKWAPQTSILAHPNCILFITHGGLLSSTEAIHFGVPIIGIPVFFDQDSNIDRATQREYGKKVILSNKVAKDLKLAIEQVVSNPQYKEKVKEISFIYHNRPVPPGEELIHWVEHVIATRGAVHLRSLALHVPFYQKMYLDLFGALAIAVFFIKRFISFQIFTSKRQREPRKKKSS